MGRYYSGDIDGKFVFGIQDSNAADRFGVTGEHPYYLEYYFTEENIPQIESELRNIKEAFGKDFDSLYDIVENYGYSQSRVVELFNIDDHQAQVYLSEIADYMLGEQILEKVKEQGYCSFDAEL